MWRIIFGGFMLEAIHDTRAVKIGFAGASAGLEA